MANNHDPFAALEMAPAESADVDPFAALEMKAPEEPSLMQKVGALGKGVVAGAAGALPDILTMPYNIAAQTAPGPVYHPGMERSEMEEFAQKTGTPLVREQMPLIPSVTEAVSKGISKYAGETPEDVKHFEKGAEFIGGLLGPGAIAKGAAKLGQTGAAKVLGALGTTKPTELAGAGVAGTAMSKLQEEGYNPLASIGAGIGAGGLTAAGFKGLKIMPKTPSQIASQLLSFGAKPNEQMVQTARKFGIEPPSNIQLNSKLGTYLNNSYLKSVFSAEKYQQAIKDVDQKMIDNVVNKVNSVNPQVLEKEGASKLYREALTEEAKQVEKQSDELYESARSYLKPEDKVKPGHTLNMIKDLQSKLTATVPSADMKFVLKKLSELSSGWGLAPKGLKTLEKEYPPEILSKYLKTLKTTAPEIPLDQLMQQRSAFLRDINYGEEARGAKSFMKPLISALDKDIDTASNKEFIGRWREANKFFKNEVANRIRTDFAESLTKSETPKEAYAYMSSPQHIHELERILGSSPATKQVMSSLKRSKLQEVVLDQVKKADGTMSYANLANLFNKKSTKQGMLKSLLGTKNYQDLNELSQLAANFSKLGKEYANPSGSALTKQDFERIGGFMKNILSVVPLGGPYTVSRIVSNPKYVAKAVEYAKARSQNLPKAQRIKNEMKKIFTTQILPQVREAEAQSQKEKAPE